MKLATYVNFCLGNGCGNKLFAQKAVYKQYTLLIRDTFIILLSNVLNADVSRIICDYYVQSEEEHFETVIRSGNVRADLKKDGKLIGTITLGTEFVQKYSSDIEYFMLEFDSDRLTNIIYANMRSIFGREIEGITHEKRFYLAGHLSVELYRQFIHAALKIR